MKDIYKNLIFIAIVGLCLLVSTPVYAQTLNTDFGEINQSDLLPPSQFKAELEKAGVTPDGVTTAMDHYNTFYDTGDVSYTGVAWDYLWADSKDTDILKRLMDENGVTSSAGGVPSLGDENIDDTTTISKDTVSVGNPLDPGFSTESLQQEGGVIGYLQERLSKLLNIMFGLLAVGSLVPITFGSIHLITSQGASDKVEKGRKALFWGVGGLILAFSSIVVMNFLLTVVLASK